VQSFCINSTFTVVNYSTYSCAGTIHCIVIFLNIYCCTYLTASKKLYSCAGTIHCIVIFLNIYCCTNLTASKKFYFTYFKSFISISCVCLYICPSVCVCEHLEFFSSPRCTDRWKLLSVTFRAQLSRWSRHGRRRSDTVESAAVWKENRDACETSLYVEERGLN